MVPPHPLFLVEVLNNINADCTTRTIAQPEAEKREETMKIISFIFIGQEDLGFQPLNLRN